MDFVDSLGDLADADAVCTSLAGYLERFGFKFRSMYDTRSPSGEAINDFYFTNSPAELHDIYVQMRMTEVSPWVTRSARLPGVHLMDPSHREADPDGRNTIYAQIRMEFGLRHGMAVAVNDPDGTRTMLALTNPEPLDLHPNATASIHLACIYARTRMGPLASALPLANPLTPREREVLTWCAAGKSAAEIADILGVAGSTAVFHTANAVRKLGASNKTHAVARALAAKIIQL